MGTPNGLGYYPLTSGSLLWLAPATPSALQVFGIWAGAINKWHRNKGFGGLSPDEVSTWAPLVHDLCIFPTTRDSWCSLEQGLYINDDAELARYFLEACETGGAQFQSSLAVNP